MASSLHLTPTAPHSASLACSTMVSSTDSHAHMAQSCSLWHQSNATITTNNNSKRKNNQHHGSRGSYSRSRSFPKAVRKQPYPTRSQLQFLPSPYFSSSSAALVSRLSSSFFSSSSSSSFSSCTQVNKAEAASGFVTYESLSDIYASLAAFGFNTHHSSFSAFDDESQFLRAQEWTDFELFQLEHVQESSVEGPWTPSQPTSYGNNLFMIQNPAIETGLGATPQFGVFGDEEVQDFLFSEGGPGLESLLMCGSWHSGAILFLETSCHQQQQQQQQWRQHQHYQEHAAFQRQLSLHQQHTLAAGGVLLVPGLFEEAVGGDYDDGEVDKKDEYQIQLLHSDLEYDQSKKNNHSRNSLLGANDSTSRLILPIYPISLGSRKRKVSTDNCHGYPYWQQHNDTSATPLTQTAIALATLMDKTTQQQKPPGQHEECN